MATGETTINSLGSIERRRPIQTSENWYHTLQHPLCFPLCLNVVHRAKAESCSAHCGDPLLRTMVIQNMAARSASERKGSSSLSSPMFSRKFTSLSFTFGWRQWDHFSACFNMSCRIYSCLLTTETVCTDLFRWWVNQWLFGFIEKKTSAMYHGSFFLPFLKYFFFIFLFQSIPEKSRLLYHYIICNSTKSLQSLVSWGSTSYSPWKIIGGEREKEKGRHGCS